MIHIFGGGTVNHVRNHLAICAPAYGNTARQIYEKLDNYGVIPVRLQLTKMADYKSNMETNDDVAARLDELIAYQSTKAIVFNVALCDFYGKIDDVESGKYAERLKSRNGDVVMQLTPANKLLSKIKKLRPDIILVGFKTTADAGLEDQLQLCRRQIAETDVDMVFANDTVTRRNILVCNSVETYGSREDVIDCMVSRLVKLYDTVA